MKKLYSLVFLAFMGILGIQAQNSITSIDQTYSQDFNTLADTGATYAFDLANWAISTETYRVSDGSANTGTVYSFGAAESTERALGAVTSGSTSNISIGTSFKNETGKTIGTVEVSFTGEQWRRSNKTLDGAFVGDTLVFQYSKNATSPTDGSASWTTVSALEFVSPNIFDGTSNGQALDGNLAENSKAISGSFEANVAPGQTLTIRWNYVRKTGSGLAGSRDGIAIDDVSVSFNEGGEVVENCDYDWADYVEEIWGDFITDEKIYLEFTEIEGASGYIVLLDVNPIDLSYEYGEPVDGVEYTVGQYINESLVVALTTTTRVEIDGLVSGNYYEIYIQPYYICENEYFYGDYNGVALDLSEDDPCADPEAYYSDYIDAEVDGNNVTFTIAEVEGAVGYIVFVDKIEEIDEYGLDYEWGFPENGEEYVSGQTLGMSYVAYVGPETTVTVSLDEYTEYYVSVHPIFECDGELLYGDFMDNEFETGEEKVPTGIKDIKNKELSIYPNPVSGNVINVQLDAAVQGKGNILIHNVLGAQVYAAQATLSANNQITLPTSLPAGRYSIRIEQDGIAQVGSFIVIK